MNNLVTIWLAAIFIIISLVYTGCSYLQKDNEDKDKYKNYVAAKAVIDQVLPVRVTRYGAKQARYNLTIIPAGGAEKIARFNCEIGGTHQVNDTVTVYYDPAQPASSEVKSERP